MYEGMNDEYYETAQESIEEGFYKFLENYESVFPKSFLLDIVEDIIKEKKNE